MIDNRDRFFGAIFGAILGDCLGMPYEFKYKEDFTYSGKLESGGPFRLKKGMYTDDSIMILCAIESYNEKGEFDPRYHMTKFLRWYEDGYLSPTKHCFDIGNQTANALTLYAYNGKFPELSKTSAGNGSLMRIIPDILYSIYSYNNVVADSSNITHNNKECMTSCLYMYTYISKMFTSNKPEKIKDDLLKAGFPDIDEDKHVNGYVIGSLHIALKSFAETNSYEEAIKTSVEYGGDTDTNAAITGMLAGAYYGFGSLDQDMLTEIFDYQMIYNKVELFYQMCQNFGKLV